MSAPGNSKLEINNKLFDYCLRIGDTSLIAGQRLSEWCGHGPALEEDIALSNMALDLIGQSRMMLTYAGQLEGKCRTEDDLAYFRDERHFRNVLLAEQPNGDFAVTIARQFFLSTYLYFTYEALKKSSNENLKAFSEKAIKEIAYHLRHTSDWMLRLGDGTNESHRRLQDAVNDLWIFIDDLFYQDDNETALFNENLIGDLASIKEKWFQKVEDVFSKALIEKPVAGGFMRLGSREGKHTEHLGFILAEMQFLPRAYPEAKW